MSVDLLVILATSKAPNRTSWNRALSAAHVPASLSVSVDLRRHGGFLPVRVQGHDTGFEFGIESTSGQSKDYPALGILSLQEPIGYIFSFVHYDECAAAFLSASVLVSRFQGVAFDPQAGAVMSLAQVNEAAGTCLNLVPR